MDGAVRPRARRRGVAGVLRHQRPAGDRQSGRAPASILRFQELEQYWTHWAFAEQGKLLSDLYTAAHDVTEGYGGIPPAQLYFLGGLYDGQLRPEPRDLERLIKNNGFGNQPNAFVSMAIEQELKATGSSQTWQGLYAQSVAGRAMPVAHYSVDVTDPAKRTALTAAYRAVMDGSMPRDQLADLRDIFRDAVLPEISVRLMLPADSARKMPPPRYHELSDAERDLVIAELRK